MSKGKEVIAMEQSTDRGPMEFKIFRRDCNTGEDEFCLVFGEADYYTAATRARQRGQTINEYVATPALFDA